jgi:YegS/Rv2252/BmrU family lipid kinase
VNKPKLIYNPAAGKGDAAKLLPEVETLLAGKNFDYDLVLTEGPDHARQIALQAAEEGCHLIIAAGGDGTVNEVINGLMQAKENGTQPSPAFAVLPVGRGNDFAFGMEIPQTLEEAVDTVVTGKGRQIDIGRVSGGDYPEGRYFGNGVGLGFDTVVGFEAAKIKWLHGAASYLAALVRTIFLYAKAPVYELVMDGKSITQPFLMVSIMNGRRMGGSFHMAPDGDPGDGLFNLCLVGQVSQLRILPVAMKIMKGSQGEDPAVELVQTKTLTINAIEGSIPAHADGETICTAGESLTIEILPKALQILSKANGACA